MWSQTNEMVFPHAQAFSKVPSLNPNNVRSIVVDYLNYNRESQYSWLSLQSFLPPNYDSIHGVLIVC